MYQVLFNGKAPDVDCQTKKEAQRIVREAKKKGLYGTIWNTRDNPVSRLLRF